MGDVVRTVAGWVERLRDAGRMETVFVRSGVQGLMGGEPPKRKPRRPKLIPAVGGTWLCDGPYSWAIGDTPAGAFGEWRRALPWWRRWLVPRARPPKRRGHVPPRAVPPPAPRGIRCEVDR